MKPIFYSLHILLLFGFILQLFCLSSLLKLNEEDENDDDDDDDENNNPESSSEVIFFRIIDN